MSSVQQYIEDAAWLPFRYDAGAHALKFVHAPREVQRRTTFLDPRFLTGQPESESIPVRDLSVDALRARAGPMHFIFHSAFCCSTLAARAFDVPGVSMGLKEPSVLADIAASGSASPQRTAALSASLDLLSRPLAAGEVQIVKPSNFGNLIMADILRLRPDAKAIVMHSSLEQFLQAIARRDTDGRRFGRMMYVDFNRAAPLGRAAPESQFLLCDLQIAAKAWVMQAAVLAKSAQEFAPRVRLLSKDRFLGEPARALFEMARFFGLPLSEAQCAAIVSGGVFSEHAKSLGIRFDANDHARQERGAAASHAKEIAEAAEGIKVAAQVWGAPTALGDTLF
jgi:hypothetical protein